MAKIVDFFDGSTTASVPTVGDTDTSALLTFADDAAYEAANTGSPLAGDLYYNSTSNVIRYYDAGAAAWKTVVNLTDLIAADVTVTPSGNLTSTDVQAALEEHQGDLDTNTTDIGTNDTDITNLQNDKIETSEKGAANGVAELDAGGKIPQSQVPAIAITEVSVVGSEAAMIALVAEEGDFAKRTDEGVSYINNGGTAGDVTDWTIVHDAFDGANDTLSNLASPTAINQDLIPAASEDLGTAANRWERLFIGCIVNVNGRLELDGSFPRPAGGNAYGMTGKFFNALPMTFASESQATTIDSDDVSLESGNTVDGDAGNTTIRPGIASGTGDDGDIVLDDPSKGTVGHVWTSKGTAGEGEWSAAGGSTPINAKARPSSDQTIGNSSSTLLDIGTVLYDTDSGWDTGSDTYTIPVAGKYMITGNVRWASSSVGGRAIGVRVNGGTINFSSFIPAFSTHSNSFVFVDDFSVNDDIQIFVLQSSGGDLDVNASATNIDIFKID